MRFFIHTAPGSPCHSEFVELFRRDLERCQAPFDPPVGRISTSLKMTRRKSPERSDGGISGIPFRPNLLFKGVKNTLNFSASPTEDSRRLHRFRLGRERFLYLIINNRARFEISQRKLPGLPGTLQQPQSLPRSCRSRCQRMPRQPTAASRGSHRFWERFRELLPSDRHHYVRR